jgi:hypothetical protein
MLVSEPVQLYSDGQLISKEISSTELPHSGSDVSMMELNDRVRSRSEDGISGKDGRAKLAMDNGMVSTSSSLCQRQVSGRE